MVMLRYLIVVMLMNFLMEFGFNAFAQERRRAVVEVKERKREKLEPKASGPRLNRSAVFAIEVEKKLIQGIDKTVSFLEKTARSLPKQSPQRLQILERTLNLYMEQATYTRSEEERIYDQRWRRWDETGRKGPEPRMDNRRSKEQWKSVIKQSSLILKEYPRAQNADTITFNQAVALIYLGQETDGARMFTQLIQKYPNSAIAGEAYASLGDFYFDRNDFRNAQRNFQRALKYKRSKRYIWSIFKLGWCSFNQNDYRRALSYWQQVVKLGKSGNQQAQILREDALRDMVYAFAELRQIEQAIAYYRANGGQDYIGPFLTLLAAILADQGEYAQSIKVLKRFQGVVPFDEKGPEAQKEIVSLNNAMGKYNMVWRELELFTQRYGPKSSWASRQKPELVAETQAVVKDQMMYYASLTHQKAIKDNNRRLNNEAKQGYLLYLKHFPNTPEIPGVKYFLADIEYYLKNFRESGRYYFEIASLGREKAVRFNPQTKKTVNIHRESAVYMVNSFVKDFEPEFNVLKKRKPEFDKPKPISPRARNYIRACERYSEWYPKDLVRIKSCDTGIANIFYHSGHKKEAIAYLKRLAIKYPTAKEGPSAIELLIPVIGEDRQALLVTANEFLKIPAYRQGKMGEKLRGLQRGAEKEAIAKEQNILKRAQAYEAQARKYPRDPEVDKLWYNAAVDYIKAGEIEKAVAAYLVLVTRFPKTEQAREALLQVAQIYERQLEFEKASNYFLEFNKIYSDSKEAPGALSRACELQIALNTRRSLSVCLAFANRFPDNAKVYIERLIQGAERAKRYNQMTQMIQSQYLNKFKLNPNEQIVAWYRIYRANNGSGPLAANAVAQMTSVFQRSANSVAGEALRYIGELYYKQAESTVPRYFQVKLQGGTVENLVQSIQVKAQALAQLEAAMNQVVSTKDAYWGVAALYQLGFANEHFAELLANPPAIEGASPEDVLNQLKPQIDQIKRAALSWYRTGQDTVTRFNVYNEWSVRTISGLARVTSNRLQFDDYVVAPDFLGTEIAASIISDLR
ncbi:MAG: tetratricopeptide repeat protein [Oligoflexus sp.]